MTPRPLRKRFGDGLVAVLMVSFFAVAVAAWLLVFLPLVARYIATGKEAHRDAIKLPGKSFDQLVNAAWFGGHPKETISSHAGRWLTAFPNTAPWWAYAVDRITDLVESQHVFKAIEDPFIGMPLE